jgi:hypothetical protein
VNHLRTIHKKSFFTFTKTRKMRLSESQIKTIKQVAREVWGDKVKVYLFGSRTDDLKKGGDIDLFIQPEKEFSPKSIMLQKAEFLSKIEILLGAQKIDVLIRTPFNNQLPIVKTAQIKGIVL